MKRILTRTLRGLRGLAIAAALVLGILAVILLLIAPMIAVDHLGSLWPLLAYVPVVLVVAYFLGDD